MHKTSCGPGGTHTRLCGDVLPNRRLRVYDITSIKGNTPSTNQELVHGSKGPLPHGNGLETPQTPLTHLETHLAVTQTKGGALRADPS
jgi:hypothetical protein